MSDEKSDRYVMTLIAPSFPSIHCLMLDETLFECYWLFPELSNNEPGRWCVPLDLLEDDIRVGNLVPVHIAAQELDKLS